MPRCLSFRSPRPPQIGNEQKAAFIEENQPGTKFAGFFLSVATCSVSISLSPFHSFVRPVAQVFGSSSAWPSIFSKHDNGDSEYESMSLLLELPVSVSRGLLNTQLLETRVKVFAQASLSVHPINLLNVLESPWALIPAIPLHDRHEPTILWSSARRLAPRLHFDNFHLPQAYLLLEVFYNPFVEVLLLFSFSYVNIFSLYVSNLFAKLNNSGLG